jgi:hypothetical protein
LGHGKYGDFKAIYNVYKGRRDGGEYGSIKIRTKSWWKSNKIFGGELVGVLSPRIGRWRIMESEGNLQLNG